MRDLIIVVDTQADFMLPDGTLPVAGADALVPPLAEWLGGRTASDTAAIVFTFDTHFAETYPDSPEARLFPIHCVKGTPGWRNLLDPLTVPAAIPCRTLEKGVFDMWAEDGLVLDDPRGALPAVPRDGFFAELRDEGIDRAIVVGVAADYCVRWAIDGLIDRGFAVTVPTGLTRGIDRSIEQVLHEDFVGRPVSH
ncbi:MAG: isochorismatase family protein [Sphingomonas paucimobilis]